jgi:hypothetical protein
VQAGAKSLGSLLHLADSVSGLGIVLSCLSSEPSLGNQQNIFSLNKKSRKSFEKKKSSPEQ